jgi:hypothetical protein
MPALYTQTIKISEEEYSLLRKSQFQWNVGMYSLFIAASLGVIPLVLLLALNPYDELHLLLVASYIGVLMAAGTLFGIGAIKEEHAVVIQHGGNPKRRYIIEGESK